MLLRKTGLCQCHNLLGGDLCGIGERHDVEHDAVQLEVLGRIDAGNALGQERGGVLVGYDPADNDRHVTEARGAHAFGGVLSAFCDHLLGCVCYPAMDKGQWAATTEFKINLTRPVSGGVVSGRAEIINKSRSQAVVRIDVYNDDRLCAVAQGTCTIMDPR